LTGQGIALNTVSSVARTICTAPPIPVYKSGMYRKCDPWFNQPPVLERKGISGKSLEHFTVQSIHSFSVFLPDGKFLAIPIKPSRLGGHCCYGAWAIDKCTIPRYP